MAQFQEGGQKKKADQIDVSGAAKCSSYILFYWIVRWIFVF